RVGVPPRSAGQRAARRGRRRDVSLSRHLAGRRGGARRGSRRHPFVGSVSCQLASRDRACRSPGRPLHHLGLADDVDRRGDAAAALVASRSGGSQFAAGVTAAAFTTLAIMAIVWGVIHVIVGVPLRRRLSWARLVALMLGSVDLVLLPYGTALGVYALWVLLN